MSHCPIAVRARKWDKFGSCLPALKQSVSFQESGRKHVPRPADQRTGESEEPEDV